jgi:hypothetical protein
MKWRIDYWIGDRDFSLEGGVSEGDDGRRKGIPAVPITVREVKSVTRR